MVRGEYRPGMELASPTTLHESEQSRERILPHPEHQDPSSTARWKPFRNPTLSNPFTQYQLITGSLFAKDHDLV